MLISMELPQYHNKAMTKLIFYTVILLFVLGCSGLISNHPDLGNGYKFFHEGKYGLSVVNSENTIMIKHHVLDYSYDSAFVLVIQRPFRCISGRDTMTYSELNKAFKNSNFKQYWIIDKIQSCENIGFDSINQVAKYSNVYGPYTENEFIQKRNALGVPKELKLIEE